MSSDAALHATLVRWLQTSEAYSPTCEQVQRIETHISSVFIAGDDVYKLKKPVRYDFLDFSTLGQREQACQAEVRLNQRLAPQVYLEAVPITREASGKWQINGAGAVVDWLVHMRRLPSEHTLEHLLSAHTLSPEQIDQLVARLVTFYQQQPAVAISPPEYRAHLERHVAQNGRELIAATHHLPAAMVRRVHGFQTHILRLLPALFDQRVQAGKICDGHGDLRPDHIYFTSPLAIIDCVEFNAEFRRNDIADELAFLAAECDFRGGTWIGPRLFAQYQTLSGDVLAPQLIDFYKSYRAAVRAKVAALRADQLAGEEQAIAAEEARRHLEWADRYAAPHHRPLVLIVGGLSGSGKSTLAQALAEIFFAECLRSDVIRQELLAQQAFPPELAVDYYQPAARSLVYQRMLEQAAALLREGVPLILDATFSPASELEAAFKIARSQNAIVLAVECHCSRDVAQQRIVSRRSQGTDPSEATPVVLEQQHRTWQPWPSTIPQVRIDTEQPVSDQTEQVVQALRRLCTP